MGEVDPGVAAFLKYRSLLAVEADVHELEMRLVPILPLKEQTVVVGTPVNAGKILAVSTAPVELCARTGFNVDDEQADVRIRFACVGIALRVYREPVSIDFLAPGNGNWPLIDAQGGDVASGAREEVAIEAMHFLGRDEVGQAP